MNEKSTVGDSDGDAAAHKLRIAVRALRAAGDASPLPITAGSCEGNMFHFMFAGTPYVAIIAPDTQEVNPNAGLEK